MPEAASYEELNARLEADCRARQSERCGRHAETIAERLAADAAAFRALPAAPFEPCDKKAAHVSSTALVRYRTVDYSVPVYLLRLAELELIARERRMVERRIRAARFPAVKSFDSFDFAAIPTLNKMLALELARCEYAVRRENIVALGPSGVGKTHVALALGRCHLYVTR